MAQFLEIKSNYPDALLFYRMGDFYELFFDDAKDAAAILDITLTHRGRHNGEEIPMCGVPVHSSETYLHNLIKTGRHVAICEQMEDPKEAKKRGAKSVVRREVVRLVTPGTLTEDNLLNNRAHNFLASYVVIREEAAIAWADISTGEFFVTSVDSDRDTKLAAIAPNELIIPDGMAREDLEELTPYISPIARSSFDADGGEKRLCKLYGIASLDALAPFTRAQIAAMGGIVDYLAITQIAAHNQLRKPVLISADAHMQIDQATRRNLELMQALSGGRSGSLLDAIDKTISAIGGRRFEERLRTPLRDIEIINSRHEKITAVYDSTIDIGNIREQLKQTPDFERAYTRLVMGRGGPRDLRVLGDGISAANKIAMTLTPEKLAPMRKTLSSLSEFADKIRTEIIDSPPILSREGGFVQNGIYSELDELRALRDNTRQVIAEKQARYVEHANITALKIKFNNVLGYFIEVPSSHSKHMLSEEMAELFIHRQTTGNAIRFTTTELNELQSKILGATDASINFEKSIFEQWLLQLTPLAEQIAELADAIGEIDIIQCQMVHISNGWVCPEITNDAQFDITKGRHPVVESAMIKQGSDFIANSCDLGSNPSHLWLITGPNMAGKSTFLRQNAIIAILAQCGFYVPAVRAQIGIIDKIFSRIGAADDLARGRSTFMVEMIETAAILNQSSDRSLVILDEIGRGTATFDGLAIAWAVLEYLLSSIKCRGLFATHFHELTDLEKQYKGLHSAHIAIREWEDDIIFLHEVRKGAAARSYGVDVAKLAGLPASVVARARTLLETLEQEGASHELGELPLFEATPVSPPQTKSDTLAKLRDLNADFMSPREALDELYQLINSAKSEKDL